MAYSGQERIAYEHGKEDGIFGRGYDNPYDIGIEPRSYRAYDEGYAKGSVSTTPPRGPAGPQGDPGNQGSQGVPGIPGVNGSDGRSIYQGSGAPVDGVNVSASSNINDLYIDNASNGALYQKTGASTWTFQSDLADVTLAAQVDDTGGTPNVIYRGEAQPGALTSAAAWRIQEITITTDGGGNDDIATLWADGDANFDNIWDNRAALSYS